MEKKASKAGERATLSARFHLVRGVYHFGRSVSDLARADALVERGVGIGGALLVTHGAHETAGEVLLTLMLDVPVPNSPMMTLPAGEKRRCRPST